jgi:predicted methyltransferase
VGLLLRRRWRRRRAVAALAPALAGFLSCSGSTLAETDPPFPEAFRATSHRSFADVEQWRKVFDDPSRDGWQSPGAVVGALGLVPGSVVVDLGAGTGYFTRHLSAAVGQTGNVLAVETEPSMVVALRERAEREKLANVVPVLGSLDNPRLPSAFADVVLIVDTFHHIDGRLDYLRQLERTLRPNGRVAVIDWKKEPLPIGPELEHKIAREQVLYEMTAAGYRLDKELDLLPYQYFLIFRAATQ